jgi:glycosyltransferase involved in cell wall biosynthesis
MNIALFHHLPMSGGAARVLAEYVARSQHEFTLYTRRPDSNGFVTLESRVTTVRRPIPEPTTGVAQFQRLLALPRLGRQLAAEIDAAGHDVVFCHASDFVQAPEVLPFLRTPTLYYAPEALRLLYEPIPLIEGEPNDDDGWRNRLRRRLNPFEPRRRRLDRRNIRAADIVTTHSHFTAGELRRIYGVESAVVPLGVDSDLFTPAGAAREDFVLSVGALHPLKGHQFVIDALATLASPRPALVVTGNTGESGPALERLAAHRGVELELHRGLSSADLIDRYRRAGVVACAQIREPFGLVPLEAMATGAPVIAVREGGFVETLVDGKTGLLVERDPVAFGNAIARVLGDDELAAALGAVGRAAATTAWTWDRTVRGYDELLARLSDSRPRL